MSELNNDTFDLNSIPAFKDLPGGTYSISLQACSSNHIKGLPSDSVSITLPPKLSTPSVSDYSLSNKNLLLTSSFITEATAYEYYMDGELINTQNLTYTLTIQMASTNTNAYATNIKCWIKLNSDTVSSSDYTYYIDENGGMFDRDGNVVTRYSIDNVQKFALISAENSGKPMGAIDLSTAVIQHNYVLRHRLEADTIFTIIKYTE